MRPEKLYLLDILEAAEAIGRFCEPVDQDDFLQDELRQSAILQNSSLSVKQPHAYHKNSESIMQS